MSKPLPLLYRSMVEELATCGGSGTVDIHGRLVAGAPSRKLQGDAVAWLRVAQLGLIAGDGTAISLTETGRAAVEGVIAGRTKTAASF